MTTFIAVRSDLVDFASTVPEPASHQTQTAHFGEPARLAAGPREDNANSIDGANIEQRSRHISEPRGLLRFNPFRIDLGHGQRVLVADVRTLWSNAPPPAQAPPQYR